MMDEEESWKQMHNDDSQEQIDHCTEEPTLFVHWFDKHWIMLFEHTYTDTNTWAYKKKTSHTNQRYLSIARDRGESHIILLIFSRKKQNQRKIDKVTKKTKHWCNFYHAVDVTQSVFALLTAMEG